MRFITAEYKKLIVPFFIVIAAGTIYELISLYSIYQSSQIGFPIELWNYTSDVLSSVFPVLASIPFCWQVYSEKKSNFFQYVHSRIRLRRYIRNKFGVTVFLSGFSMMIINAAGLFITMYYYAGNIPAAEPEYTAYYASANFLGQFQLDQPLAYGLLLSVWRGILAALICGFGFMLALYCNNIFAVLSGPFVYSILENFITAVLQKPAISLVTAIDPNRLSSEMINFGTLLAGPLILIVFSCALCGYFRYKERCDG